MITDGRDLPAITCLLESSPVLEKLTLSMKPSDNRRPFVCVSWPKLNVLTIGYANQSNEIVAQSLSGIPMLEFLRLQRCNGINRLIVISSNFKELLIDGPRERFSSTWCAKDTGLVWFSCYDAEWFSFMYGLNHFQDSKYLPKERH
ncbi:hypothetical protein WN943_012348 [Citrus x changshan-huyou]